MRQTAHYTEKPAEIMLYALESGATDVWMRKNIKEEPVADTESGGTVTQWVADEVYARFGETLTEEAIRERWDDYWNVGENWPTVSPEELTDHERLVALEQGKADKVDVEELNEALNMILTGATE